jgi:hypothetical protein
LEWFRCFIEIIAWLNNQNVLLVFENFLHIDEPQMIIY